MMSTNSIQSGSQTKIDEIYCKINAKNSHTVRVYDEQVLQMFYKQQRLNNPNMEIIGKNRYYVENNGNYITNTMQGSVYSAIDIITGRRVIVKQSNKYLVHSNSTKNGIKISENIKTESNLLKNITSNQTSDAGM